MMIDDHTTNDFQARTNVLNKKCPSDSGKNCDLGSTMDERNDRPDTDEIIYSI